ncbi:MAG: ArnT family glycosyltransferase [Prolixibacteraceae bacterium]
MPKIIQSKWFLVIAFLILVGPLALNFNFYYPDEVHYTDAAIQMLQNGDYLTPVQGSGEVRFNKPILTYWVVLLGYKLFGISAFASRIFFFLSGALVFLLTFNIAKLIYSKQSTALLGTAIAVSNTAILMSSLRSIPDVLLCLFMTSSALGFAGFIKYGQRTPAKYNWILFVSLALAFEVKGVAALVLGFAGIAFLLLNPWQRIPLKKILHWPSIIVAILIAVLWFVVIFFRYGEAFTQSFYNDQIGERISVKFGVILMNLGLSIVLILSLAIPWISFLTKASFGRKQTKEQLAFRAFVITWILTAVITSALVFKFYERYLLPVIPLYSVWLGYLIVETVQNRKNIHKLWNLIFSILHFMILTIAILITINFKASFIAYAWLILAIVLTVYIQINYLKSKSYLWLTISLLFVAFNLSIVTYKISFPDEGEQISEILKNTNIDPLKEIGMVGDLQIASKVRIASKGTFHIVNIADLYAEYESENYETLIVSEVQIKLFPAEDFTIIGNSVSWNSSESKNLTLAILTGEYSQLLRLRGKKYYILRRIS